MRWNECTGKTDKGPFMYVANVEQETARNVNFRTAFWTGSHLQMTLMCIPPCGEIGVEMHEDTDQFIRIEQGTAVIMMGKCENQMDFQQNICKGDTVFVPAKTWHNVINIGRNLLKISSTYAPPNHRMGTVHRTQRDAQREDD